MCGQSRARVAFDHGVSCIHGDLFNVIYRKQNRLTRSIPTLRPNVLAVHRALEMQTK